MARHEVAVRKARSGAVMGAAVTLLPVYAVANASRRLGVRLRRRLQRAIGQKVDQKADQKELSGSSASDVVQSVEALLSSAQVALLAFEGEKITGVASDLETRSLVLVKDYRIVWHGLSVEQQRHLQKEMAALLDGRTEGLVLPAQSGLSLPERSRALVRSVVSFWVEVLWMMTWLHENVSPNSNFQLVGGFDYLGGRSRPDNALPGKRSQKSLGRRDSARPLLMPTGAISVVGTAPLARVMQTQPSEICLTATVDSEDCLEASVVTVGYVEHPFETVLNWVDRFLVRVESIWRWLWQWLLQWRSVLRDEK